MNLLLDTHVLLWAIDQPELLSPRVVDALGDELNVLFASVASLWEISLKVQAGKLSLPKKVDFLEGHLRRMGITGYLPVELMHVRQVRELPLLHKDPFDRILVAQAVVEGMTLVSKDEAIRGYAVEVLW